MKALLFALALFVIALDGHAGKYPREAVVKVEVPMGGSGSAVVLQKDLMLTARHVADNEGLVLSAGGAAIKVVETHASYDVAAIKGAVRCPCAEMAASDAKLDEMVTIIGWPNGIANQVVRGEAQGLHDIPGWGRMLVVAVATEGGNSGGGAFVMRDGRWQLVGILVAGSKTQSLVVPISTIRKWFEGRK